MKEAYAPSSVDNKMKLLKNKKSQEGTGLPLSHIIGFIILFALLVFVLFWYSDLGSKITQLLKSVF